MMRSVPYGLLLLTLILPLLAVAEIKPVWHEGRKYVQLDDLAEFYGGQLTPGPGQKVLLRTRWTELEFMPDQRSVLVGGVIVWMHEPMQRIRRQWAIGHADAVGVIDPIMRPSEYLKSTPHRVVVLDPGHGGEDSGAKGKRGSQEKHSALDIARRVRSHLVAAGLKVYLTRENDRFISLEDRPQRAKRWGSDLFVSIHLNSAQNTFARGVETFALTGAGLSSTAGGNPAGASPGNRYDAQNTLLAFHIHRAMQKNVNAVDRGVKRARFIVLRNAPCPAVLVECGFLSDIEDEKKLMTEAYRETVAQGIAKGIMIYVGLSKQAQRPRP